jgi:hypothetical protein
MLDINPYIFFKGVVHEELVEVQFKILRILDHWEYNILPYKTKWQKNVLRDMSQLYILFCKLLKC